ncbi:hypothetical protein GYMLUDRAFT_70767 [Collybiopsis luxurians FD-317 M1]|nr:hypothetical protein GYMLUDRAFT_70767 [Collybiopsis luxurians FD-317 M1]
MDPHTPLISSSPVSASGSPPLRSTILGSFLGRSNRTRNSSSQQRDRDREMSPPANLAPPLVSPPSVQPIPSSNPNPVPIINNPIPPNPTPPSSSSFRLRLVPHLDSRRSLRFDPITRDMRAGDPVLRIGRFTDRSGQNQNQNGGYNNNNPNSFKMAFKSKVVSRTHAELWVECSPSSDTGSSPQPKFFVRDTSSSSGTFINHVRLSAANTASRPFQIRDGDILQLGVDYQGGSEDIYKCVKIRVEVGRDWMRTRNEYNAIAMKNLKSLAQSVNNAATPSSSTKKKAKFSGAGLPDCCICLCSLTPFQPLFVSPCSHTFHYKCIRPLIEKHYPGFCCPLCRTYGDLEEDVEVELEEEIGDVEDGVENHAGLAGGDDVDVDIDASDERRRVGLGGGVEDGDGDGDRQEGEDHELEEVGDPGEGYVDPRVEEEDGRGKRKMGVGRCLCFWLFVLSR